MIGAGVGSSVTGVGTEGAPWRRSVASTTGGASEEGRGGGLGAGADGRGGGAGGRGFFVASGRGGGGASGRGSGTTGGVSSPTAVAMVLITSIAVSLSFSSEGLIPACLKIAFHSGGKLRMSKPELADQPTWALWAKSRGGGGGSACET